MNKLIVSLSPHVHGGDSVKKNMYGVLIALIPAFLVSLYFFGLGALIVTATSVAACLFFEWAIGKFLMKKETTTITDGSAIITGVLLAFNLPSNLPIWIIILGALFAIGVGKMSFGGLGCNPFNPALAGRVFLLLSFPVQMTTWPAVGQLTAYTDATTAATPLAIMKGVINGAPGMSLSDLPGPFTFILNGTNRLPKIFRNRKEVGIRMPDNHIIREIARLLDAPIMTTTLPHEENEDLEYITDPELIDEKFGDIVDLVIDGGDRKSTRLNSSHIQKSRMPSSA